MTYTTTAIDITKRALARGDTAWATQLAKQLASDTASYELLRQEGDLLFRVGLAGSSWEGMGQYANEHPELIDAIRAETRAAQDAPPPFSTGD